MDSISLIGMASVIAAGLSIGIGAIGPAIGEGRAVARPCPPWPSSRTRPTPSRAPCSWVWP